MSAVASRQPCRAAQRYWHLCPQTYSKPGPLCPESTACHDLSAMHSLHCPKITTHICKLHDRGKSEGHLEMDHQPHSPAPRKLPGRDGGRGHERPGQVAVQGQHAVVEAPVEVAGIGVHHAELPPQVVPKLAQAAVLIEPDHPAHKTSPHPYAVASMLLRYHDGKLVLLTTGERLQRTGTKSGGRAPRTGTPQSSHQSSRPAGAQTFCLSAALQALCTPLCDQGEPQQSSVKPCMTS